MDRATELRALHEAPELLVLVNVWDAASARVVARQPGCKAIATASWAVAAAHGVKDGELGADLMLEAVGRIAAAVDLPVTADLEDGYDDVADTMGRAYAAGVDGCNIEDKMRPLEEATERVRAAVGAGLVVNARTDAFLFEHARALDEAIARGRAYLEAGAVCVFVPGVSDRETIRTLVAEIGPINVFATPQSPSLAELQELGVARVSFGPGLMGVAFHALAEAAEQLLAHGEYPQALTWRPGRG